MSAAPTVTLWRPVGPAERALIQASGMCAFPPRLLEQPTFYPVTTEDYAGKIARDWNVPASGAGVVMRFKVRADYLAAFNAAIVGSIESCGVFRRKRGLERTVYNAYAGCMTKLAGIKSSVVTARLTPETMALVDRVAGAQGRSRSWFAAEAIRRVAESEAEFLGFLQEGIDAADRGELISQEDMAAWFASRGLEAAAE